MGKDSPTISDNPSHPGISIIVPVHCRYDNVRNLISSIHYQSEDYDVEVIIVDDSGSTPFFYDGEAGNIRLKLIRNAQNIGANPSRKIGYEASEKEVIHFHDSDDLLAPNWIKAIVSEFSDNSALDLVVTPRISENLSSPPISLVLNDRMRNFEGNPKELAKLQYVVNIIGPLGGVTFRRNLVENFSFHNIRASQDWVMYDEALLFSRYLKYTNKTYFISRKFDENRISDNSYNRIRGYISTSKLRFGNLFYQKIFSRLYCTYGKEIIREKITVKYFWFKMRAIKLYIWIKIFLVKR